MTISRSNIPKQLTGTRKKKMVMKKKGMARGGAMKKKGMARGGVKRRINGAMKKKGMVRGGVRR
tara:strand:+ start:96 stop:287 length:192 start_codon:yes stop_codon:yes gene_type:complete